MSWTRVVAGRRTAWLVALVPMLLAAAFMVLAGEADRDAAPTDQLPAGLDSTEGTELRAELPEEQGSTAVLLWTVADGTLDAATVEELTRTAGELGALERGPEGAVTVSEDETAAIAVVPVDAVEGDEVSSAVEDLRSELSEAAPDGVRTAVTGPAAVRADLGAVFDGANTRLLAVTASVVALLLILTYRSPVLWLVPLTVVGIADRLAAVLATQVMAALGVAWDESTVGILSVLVFGAGTNYALLLISRYRDLLQVHDSRFEAMGHALHRTVEPILASATTVVLGLLTLLLSLVPSTRGLGLACAVGVVVAATFVLVVLPAALVLFGRWVFWPRVPRLGDPELADSGSFWGRVGDRVARHPGRFVVAAVAVLGIMAVGLFRIEQGLDQADQFLEEPEAISAAGRLGESFPAGLTDPARVVTRAAADEVLPTVEETAGVQRASVTNQGAGVTEIEAVLDGEPGSDRARSAVEDLRDALAAYDDTHVTGTEAEAIDEADGAARDRKVILPLILAVVLGALLLLLRAVVAPLLLVATVVATYGASLGVSWWLFTGPLGFEALDPSVPLLSFLFLVALGVDYNIFLVTRAGQEAREHGARRGMLRALTATGGVITSAGILLAAVFLVLGVLPLVVLAQMGTVICIGVLLDTLLVRTVLVPALALRLGDRFWWPRTIAAGEVPAQP